MEYQLSLVNDEKGFHLIVYPKNLELNNYEIIFNFYNEVLLQSFLKYLGEEDLKLRNKIIKINKLNDLDNLKENSIEENNELFIKDLLLSILTSWKSKAEVNKGVFRSITSLSKLNKYKQEVVNLDNHHNKTNRIEYLYILGEKKLLNNFKNKNYYEDWVKPQRLKIGITNNLRNRLYNYITHSPVEVAFLKHYPIININKIYNKDDDVVNFGFLKSSEQLEDRLKHDLAYLWIYQEWFNIRPKDLFSTIESRFQKDKAPIFKLYNFQKKYSAPTELFFEYLTKTNEEKVILYELGKLFLQNGVYGNTENNKIELLIDLEEEFNKKDNEFKYLDDFIMYYINNYISADQYNF